MRSRLQGRGAPDATLVQLSGDSPDAGEPLGPQVVYDGPHDISETEAESEESKQDDNGS